MLQTQTVRPDTFSLLKELMAMEFLRDFNLAGGTSLALQIGHRTSTDLDLFANTALDFNLLKIEIGAEYDYIIEHNTKNILIGFLNGIKVDFVRYKYDLIVPPRVEEGIRLISIEDIGCMKLAAITGRGKKRDFFDLYYILKKIPLEKLLDLYQSKFYDSSLQLVLKSITYFEDAESDEDPNLFEELSWDEVKNNIRQAFFNYYNSL